MPQQLEEQVGAVREEPHQRLEGGDQHLHRPDHAHGEPLRIAHAEPLGKQVGEHQEHRDDRDERGQEGRVARGLDAEPQLEQACEVRAQRTFADHAAEDRDRIQPDLHHGEVVARLLLHAHHAVGARVAFVGHLAQAQAARRGQRDLGQ